jgi:Spy/CpxP family protein refolding chaperone
MRTRLIPTAFICWLLIATPLSSLNAQQPDPLGENVFPPELIMQNQQAIGLTEDQKNYIITQMQEAQEGFTKLNWSLQKEVESLIKLLSQTAADEKKVTEQLDKVLQIEAQIKKKQITLMVRIKNKLTAEQQAKLKQIREQQAKPK